MIVSCQLCWGRVILKYFRTIKSSFGWCADMFLGGFIKPQKVMICKKITQRREYPCSLSGRFCSFIELWMAYNGKIFKSYIIILSCIQCERILVNWHDVFITLLVFGENSSTLLANFNYATHCHQPESHVSCFTLYPQTLFILELKRMCPFLNHSVFLILQLPTSGNYLLTLF